MPKQTRYSAPLIPAILIVLAVAIVYSRSLAYPFTNFDDFDYVVDNIHVTTGVSFENIRWAATALHASNWHPLTWISHQLDVSIFGAEDAGKLRISSIALHAASALLLLFFLLKTTGRKWASVAVAAFFALHPLRVESVVWISERKDTLSVFLFLLTLVFYAGYVETKSWTRYALALVAFALGLMSKPMLVTTPFVLLLIDQWPLHRERSARLIIEKLPFFALVVPSVIVTMQAQQEAMHRIVLPVRLSNAIVSYASYLGKFIAPLHLAVMYPFRGNLSIGVVVACVILLMAITTVAIVYAKRFPYLVTGWLWYLGTLVPVIGIVQVGGQSMADRYTYIPSIGLTIALVWLAADLIRNETALGIAAIAACVTLAVLTFQQVGYWHDTLTLFTHAVEVTPHNAQARNALGREYLFRNEYELAQEQFHGALADEPQSDEAHDALGATLSELGDAEGAEREFKSAIALDPRPVYYRDLGQLYAALGRNNDAMAMYQKSLGMKRDPEALAEVAALKGDAAGAIKFYREAIKERPRAPDLHNNLAAMLARNGQDDQAIVEYRAAVNLAPKQYDTHMNLGAILIRRGRADEAFTEFHTATNIRPDSPEPHVYLALLYAQMKRPADALAEIRLAAQIDEEAANEQLTRALSMPPKPTNLREYAAMLESQTK